MKQFIVVFKLSEDEDYKKALEKKHIRIPINEKESGGIEINYHKGDLSKKWYKRIG